MLEETYESEPLILLNRFDPRRPSPSFIIAGQYRCKLWRVLMKGISQDRERYAECLGKK